MQRRQVLKNLGLTFGVAVATPSMVGLLQNCQSNTAEDQSSVFFNTDEYQFIQKLTDVIFPKTAEAPSGSEVMVHQFIDKYADNVLSPEERTQFRKSFDAVKNVLNKENIAMVKENEIIALLDEYLKKSEHAEDSDAALAHSFLQEYRDRAIWAYKISEQVGKNVLAYNPIPGKEKGCISVQEATGGKAWSLQ